ncbi:hypothetical protein SETIT_6G098900v2 [Setaria italica]|uniref:Myb/SANT-like domain-containing protein n=1 Tax=Setaria italica TaxID=4555 RepID=A0A368RJV6_SETIT|nr:hypothetical protein SETIT_6G098900v2 [Setaria italica]
MAPNPAFVRRRIASPHTECGALAARPPAPKDPRNRSGKGRGGPQAEAQRAIDAACQRGATVEQENEANKHFRGKAFPFYDELTTLFGTTDKEGSPMLCVGGIGDRTPSSRSEGNPNTAADENEHVVDNPPPKRTKSMEYYVKRISESTMQRTMNERNLISREEEEVMEMLHLVEQDGVPNGLELYFIATELFRSPARRASYRSITAAENRIAWLRWTWDNVKRK